MKVMKTLSLIDRKSQKADGLQDTGRGGKLRRLKGLFWRDEEGATAVEFTVLAAPVLGTIGMCLYIGYIFIISILLENGVSEAGRYIRVGKALESNMSRAQFKEMVCDALTISKAECNADVVIDVDSAPNVAGLPTDLPFTSGSPDPGKAQYDPGVGSDFVIVKAYLPISTMHDLFKFFGSTDNPRFILSSSTVFRNEPF